jgi:hypothetical protein
MRAPDPTPLSPPHLFLYVNKVAQGAPKHLWALGRGLQYLVSLMLMHKNALCIPIDLLHSKANSRDQIVLGVLCLLKNLTELKKKFSMCSRCLLKVLRHEISGPWFTSVKGIGDSDFGRGKM